MAAPVTTPVTTLVTTMSDALGVGTVSIELNHTLAELLARLCVELGTEDATGVVSRALGLLEMVQYTKRHGGRLCFINERGDVADVVF
jgi:pimeloyl-CoA synthetase